jgi:hypothetical protein
MKKKRETKEEQKEERQRLASLRRMLTHTVAYVSIRQHTSASVERQRIASLLRIL